MEVDWMTLGGSAGTIGVLGMVLRDWLKQRMSGEERESVRVWKRLEVEEARTEALRRETEELREEQRNLRSSHEECERGRHEDRAHIQRLTGQVRTLARRIADEWEQSDTGRFELEELANQDSVPRLEDVDRARPRVIPPPPPLPREKRDTDPEL